MGIVSTYFTVILPGFQMLFVITGSSLKRGAIVLDRLTCQRSVDKKRRVRMRLTRGEAAKTVQEWEFLNDLVRAFCATWREETKERERERDTKITI